MLKCAKAAKESDYYNMHVEWLQMALKMAPQNYQKSLQKQINKAMKLHDDMFYKHNFQVHNIKTDRALTLEKPYNITKFNKIAVKSRQQYRKKHENYYDNFVQNIKKDNTGRIKQFAPEK